MPNIRELSPSPIAIVLVIRRVWVLQDQLVAVSEDTCGFDLGELAEGLLGPPSGYVVPDIIAPAPSGYMEVEVVPDPSGYQKKTPPRTLWDME